MHCRILLNIISHQPEAARRSHWARHWVCAIDVMELLAAESALTHDVGKLVARGDREGTMDNINVTLKRDCLELMGDHYRPGEQWAVHDIQLMHIYEVSRCIRKFTLFHHGAIHTLSS